MKPRIVLPLAALALAGSAATAFAQQSRTATPTASRTSTPTVTRTATHTPTRTATRTATSTPALPPASDVEPASTPRITVISNSNASPTARGGVDPSQPDRANGLPDAGNDGPAIQWWRWSFFGGALMLAVAGWFFTFAMHYGDREVVLMDGWEARRRKHQRRLPRR